MSPIGYKHTEEAKNRIRMAHLGKKRPDVAVARLGSLNPMWKGDKVGIKALHRWVKNRFPKSPFCQLCKQSEPHDLANISQEYKRDLSDWEWLCRHCHMTKDGRFKNLAQYQPPKPKEWSRFGFKWCVECHANTTNHRAFGFCHNCYARIKRNFGDVQRYKANAELEKCQE